MKKWLSLLFLCCFCTDESYSPSSKQLERFTTVYQDYLVIMSSDTARLEGKERYLTQLLKKNQLGREEFDRIAVFMQTHPQAFEKIMSKTVERLQKESVVKKSAK